MKLKVRLGIKRVWKIRAISDEFKIKGVRFGESGLEFTISEFRINDSEFYWRFGLEHLGWSF